MNPLLVIVISLGLAGSLALGISALIPSRRPPGPPTRWQRGMWWLRYGSGSTSGERRRHQMWLAAAIVGGIVAALISGLPVAGILVAVAVPGVPWLLASGRAEQQAITRLEAVEAWTRRLHDVEDSGHGLQGAIVETAATAPPAIAEPVRDLVARIQAGWDPRDALSRFGATLSDPLSDQVVAALMLHLRDRGAKLPDILSGIADTAAEGVAARRETAAKRAKARFQIRFLVGMCLVLLAFGIASPDLTAAYREPRGQVALTLFALAAVGCLWWARVLSLPPRPSRFLAAEEPTGEEPR